jgi:hypothetical protein
MMMMREVECSEGKECSYISRSRACSALVYSKASLYRRRLWVVFGVASDVIGFPSWAMTSSVTPAQRNHLHGPGMFGMFIFGNFQGHSGSGPSEHSEQ